MHCHAKLDLHGYTGSNMSATAAEQRGMMENKGKDLLPDP
jgi:hypothetical protein